MTIDEAKICLSIQVEVKHRLGKDFEARALQMGLEALQFFKGAQREAGGYQKLRLSGETE